jgi:predicted amidohydrolase
MTSFSGTTPTDAVELQKFISPDAESIGTFGKSSSVSLDGNTILIGAPQGSFDKGAAYVFTRSAGTWTQQQKLTASDGANNDGFGESVALSSDGLTAIVGAPEEDTSPTTNNGAAYIYTFSGGTWTQQQKLLISDPDGGDFFGYSVSLSSDGNTALIGAFFEDTSPTLGNGAAYVFTRSAGVWTQQAKLLASDRAESDVFGESVALSADGNTAIVGAPEEDTSPNTSNGAAYVFTRSGSTWTEQQKLLASDRATDDDFGKSVSISADGNTAIVGAFLEDTSPNTYNGAAYVFTRSGSTWTEQQKLLASDPGLGNEFGGDSFGVSVSISADGNTVIIGAFGKSQRVSLGGSNEGAVYIFTRSGGVWTEQTKFLELNSIIGGTRFGSVVALSADGKIAIVSTSSGSRNVYVYALGRLLDNKLYSYDSTLGAWDVSAFGELLTPTTSVFSVFGVSSQFQIPAGAKVLEVTCIGGGGGGGGGARNVSGDGGGSGGGGGGLSKYLFRAEDLGGAGASITITVGTGGTGGVATASGTTALSGNNGVSGGTTSFGTFLYAYGGANGIGGTTTARTGGDGGVGMFVGNIGGNTSLNSSATSAGAGGGGGGGASFGTGSIPTAFNIAAPSGAGTAGTSNATLLGPGAGGNGRVSTTTTVSAAGAGGFYGGGGGGGGEGSTGGATGAGGAGGAGASGACIIKVWYG